jgi:hypothetical protein
MGERRVEMFPPRKGASIDAPRDLLPLHIAWQPQREIMALRCPLSISECALIICIVGGPIKLNKFALIQTNLFAKRVKSIT